MDLEEEQETRSRPAERAKGVEMPTFGGPTVWQPDSSSKVFTKVLTSAY